MHEKIIGNNMFEEIKQRNALVRDQIYKGFVGGISLWEYYGSECW